MENKVRILVVDCDPEWRKFVAHLLREAGYTVQLGGDVLTARLEIEGNDFELIIVDAPLLKQLQPAAAEPVRHRLLVVSAAPSVPEAIAAYRSGALDYANKAFGEASLLTTVATVLEKQPAQQRSLG